MINMLALGFVFSSLLTAFVWTPGNPLVEKSGGDGGLASMHKLNPGDEEEIVVREGHRVIVFEYQKEGIRGAVAKATVDTLNGATESAKATGHALRDVAEEATHKAKESVNSVLNRAGNAKEAVKETYDSAKNKAAGTIGTVKDEVSGKLQNAANHIPGVTKENDNHDSKEIEIEECSETDDGKGNIFRTCKKRVKDFFKDRHKSIDSTKDSVKSSEEQAKDLGDQAKQSASKGYHNAKDVLRSGDEKIKSGEEQVVQGVSKGYNYMKDTVRTGAEKVKSGEEEAANLASRGYDSAKQTMKSGFQKMKSNTENAAQEGYDSTKNAMKSGEEYVKSKAKSSLGEDSALGKFREAMDEVHHLVPEGEDFDAAARKVEEGFMNLMPQMPDSKDDVNSSIMNRSIMNYVGNITAAPARAFRMVESGLRRLKPKNFNVKNLAKLAHLLSFATIYGLSVWVNFASGHVMSKALPRQQFGIVQSKMYPFYFKSVASGLGICLLALSLLNPFGELGVQKMNLLFALGATLANMLYFEPRTTKVMFERLKLEKEEGRGKDVVGDVDVSGDGSTLAGQVQRKMIVVNRRMRVFHGYSSFCNVLYLISITWHLAYLASRLVI